MLATGGKSAGTATGTIRRAGEEAGGESCSFCGKSRLRVEALAAAGDARICNECLDLCREVVSEEV
ncbi:MAG: hypothetical protein LBI49_21310 [Nocardiopsaceae bacterium]|nr:hypothetical protein [Nocardiopsaceae bacterium]